MTRSLKTIAFLLILHSWCVAQSLTPAQLAQQQLDGYNNRDIDLFLKPYADTVKIFNHPNTLIMDGKEVMRKRYGEKFKDQPDLNCTLTNRMVLGNVVIDQEYVIFKKDQPPVQVIAMYKIANEKIVEVYFIRPELE